MAGAGFLAGQPVVALKEPTDTYTSTASPQPELGSVVFYKTSSGYISLLEYCEATDGWTLGDVLVHDAAKNPPYNLETSATGDGGMAKFGGIAAATVASASRGWVYKWGYCPAAAMPTAFASGQPMRISATYAGRLSSAVLNSSAACVATLLNYAVAVSLDVATVSTANSNGSCLIFGAYL